MPKTTTAAQLRTIAADLSNQGNPHAIGAALAQAIDLIAEAMEPCEDCGAAEAEDEAAQDE